MEQREIQFLCYFLKEMLVICKDLTGGNALFFRSRIRHSIAATDIEDVEFKFNGENYVGKQISFQPFLKTELKNRVSRYKTKKIYCNNV